MTELAGGNELVRHPRCATCEEPVPNAVHCTICGAHLHPACAPRVATDAAFDAVLRLLAAGLNTSMLKGRANRYGPQAAILALSAVLTAIWGRPMRAAVAEGRLPIGLDAVRFAKEAARLDDSWEALAAELLLLEGHR
jgi:hypothetical protein